MQTLEKNQSKQSTLEQKIVFVKKRFENKRRVLFAIFAAIILGIVSVGFGAVLNFWLGNSSYLLLLFPAVVISTWFGDVKTGILTTLITTVGIYYINFLDKLHAPRAGQLLIEYILFFAAGIVVVYFVEKSKGYEKVAQYKTREKEYLNLILELQKKYAKAQAEIKSRDEFLSIASHELKTPLTSMLLQLQTALHNIRNVSLAQFSVENLLKMLDSAEGQSKRVSKMINDLLNVSMITTGRIDLEKEKVDLAEIVKTVCDQFSQKLTNEGYTLRCKADKPIVGIFDKLRLEQVVTNLLTNAMRYGEKKPIEVTVAKQGNNGVIIVKDHGIGIPEEQQDKIFDRFTRGANGTKFEGLGVGLYITNQIVKSHGGSIEIDSEEGKGATFTVSLPLNLQQSKI